LKELESLPPESRDLALQENLEFPRTVQERRMKTACGSLTEVAKFQHLEDLNLSFEAKTLIDLALTCFQEVVLNSQRWI
jgi:hypothetical protein